MSIQVCEFGGMQLCKCKSSQIYSFKLCNHTVMQLYFSMPPYKYVSMNVCNYASVKLRIKYDSMQLCECQA